MLLRLVAVALIGMAGCGSGHLSTGNNQPGTGGTGGSGGGSAALMPPQCVRELMAECPLAGSCQVANDATNRAGSACYANGETVSIRYTTTLENPHPDAYMVIYDVRKADGSLCYSFVTSCYRHIDNCEDKAVTWRNAAGNDVAGGMWSTVRGNTVTCFYGGERCSGGGGSSGSAADCVPPTPGLECSAGSCP